MLLDELTYQIRQEFPFEPTREQLEVMHTFARFASDREPNVAMILRGSAGTGKTSLVVHWCVQCFG